MYFYRGCDEGRVYNDHGTILNGRNCGWRFWGLSQIEDDGLGQELFGLDPLYWEQGGTARRR